MCGEGGGGGGEGGSVVVCVHVGVDAWLGAWVCMGVYNTVQYSTVWVCIGVYGCVSGWVSGFACENFSSSTSRILLKTPNVHA